MEIIIGKTSGFCFGVRNAVIKAKEELQKGEAVYCLGELVHNKQVTDELKQNGMNFIEKVEDANNKMIIRAHGIDKQTYEKADRKKIKLIDLTCPKVLHTHKIVEKYANNNYFIVLVGEKKHPEMIGTVSFCGNEYVVIENNTQIDVAINKFKESKRKKMLLIAQTTYSLEKFEKIATITQSKIPKQNLKIINTICNATKERQEETKNIAKQVELMVIIGGKQSSNSNKLYELAKKYCKQVVFIETEEELEANKIRNIATIGIMAGASTPENIIKKVVEKIEKIC